jgi:hypothetical protein
MREVRGNRVCVRSRSSQKGSREDGYMRPSGQGGNRADVCLDYWRNRMEKVALLYPGKRTKSMDDTDRREVRLGKNWYGGV